MLKTAVYTHVIGEMSEYYSTSKNCKKSSKARYTDDHINVLITLFVGVLGDFCACTETALFLFPVRNLSSPSFSVTSIFCNEIEILTIWWRFWWFLDVCAYMCRNDYYYYYYWIEVEILTLPLDSATPISYISEIFRRLEDVCNNVFFIVQTENPSYLCFGCWHFNHLKLVQVEVCCVSVAIRLAVWSNHFLAIVSTPLSFCQLASCLLCSR